MSGKAQSDLKFWPSEQIDIYESPSEPLPAAMDPPESSPGLLAAESPEIGMRRTRRKSARADGDMEQSGISVGELGKVRAEFCASTNTAGSSAAGFVNAREISETASTRLFEMRWCWVAAVVNCAMILLITQLRSGVIVPLSIDVSTSVGCVILELALLVSNIVTSNALDGGASAFFGEKLASKKGYSLAVCGFLQASSFEKLSFATQLSLNSTCCKLLARCSLLWITLNVILWFTPLTATALKGDLVRRDEKTIECLMYKQRGQPIDRRWPTVIVETGVAELIFGSALGIMRSENPDVNVTTAIIPPQAIGSIGKQDMIIGSGFTIDISTTCECAPTSDMSGLTSIGINASIAAPLLDAYAPLKGAMGLANAFINDTKAPSIITLVGGTIVCGGVNETNPFVPVCKTTLSNHYNAVVGVIYMTDGTTASVAQKSVFVRKLGAPANMGYWASTAMSAILGGPFSSFRLPPTFPGAVNPLLWWTTPNLIGVDPSLIEAGIETMFSILFRAGVQRTYISEGDTCVHNMELLGVSSLDLADYGANVAIFILSFQLFATVVSILCFVPWLLSPNPIGPAVRLARDSIFFTRIMNSSSISGGTEVLCNAPPHAIWQAYDTIVRVGEPIGTRDDPAYGQLAVDRPKLLTHLTNGKRYY